MTTEERMMIMGMCLQGILANPNYGRVRPGVGSKAGPEHHTEIAANVQLAHLYAAKLAPLPEVTAAQEITRITRIAYEGLRAAQIDGSGHWMPFEQVRTSSDERDQDRLDGVFERVSLWFALPAATTGTLADAPLTRSDYFIAMVVRAARSIDPGQEVSDDTQGTGGGPEVMTGEEREQFYNDH